MIILGIETSCDETAVAIVGDGRKVFSSIVCSQVDLHRKFGGVVPEIACRAHLDLLYPALRECLKEAELSLKDVDGVAVTIGPGLIGALLIGVSTAKAICFSIEKPLLAVSHIEAHLYAGFIKDEPELPAVGLVVSGGHSELLLINELGRYRLLGRTRDDAAGEAFDKVSKLLGLGYPGGPAIEKAASGGDPGKIEFPRPYLPGSFDFSFSGLKTAVLYYVREHGCEKPGDIAAGFQQAVVDVLVRKTINACDENGVQSVLLAGGVARNSLLRKLMKEQCSENGIKFFCPPPELCTDNAVMVAGLGFVKLKKGEKSSLSVNPSSSVQTQNFLYTSDGPSEHDFS